MIQLTGLWKKKSNKGEEYLAGSLGNANIMIFQNKRKQNDKAPDFILCLGEKQRPDHDK